MARIVGGLRRRLYSGAGSEEPEVVATAQPTAEDVRMMNQTGPAAELKRSAKRNVMNEGP